MTHSAVCADEEVSGRPYRCTGKERDAESGNDYFGARYYGSSMGRFMSPDWSARAEAVPYSILSDPQTLNLYAYMHNNPLGGIDPDGHIDCSGSNGDGVGCQTIAGWYANHDVLTEASTAAIQNSNLTKQQQSAFKGAVTNAAGANGIDPNVLVGMAEQESGLGRILQSPYSSAAGLYGIEDGQIVQLNKMFSLGLTRKDTLDLDGKGLSKTTMGVGDYLGHYSQLYSTGSDPRGIDVAISFWRFGSGRTRQNIRDGNFWDYRDPKIERNGSSLHQCSGGVPMITLSRVLAIYIFLLISVGSPVVAFGMSVPSATLKSLGDRIDETFIRVSDIRLLSVGSERVDIVVIGQQRLMHQSWRVQIFTVQDTHLSLKWDSLSLRETEFTMGPGKIGIQVLDDDYRLSLEGCAQHACYDGILGFLVYLGSASKPWMAKLTTVDDKDGRTLSYDVSWFPTDYTTVQEVSAKQALEAAMCRSTGISDPTKLPFRCGQNQ